MTVEERLDAALRLIDPNYTLKQEPSTAWTCAITLNGNTYQSTEPGKLQAMARIVERFRDKVKK